MRPIRKGDEPQSLTQHRCNRYANYDNYRDKDDLRMALVAEQRGICCYCMSRIYADAQRMKIEHWACQKDHATEQLVFGNLLGACRGGDGGRHNETHCDTCKGDQALSRNPADLGHPVDRDVHYLADGTIRSDDSRFDREINDVLNLNVAFLRNNRKAVVDGLKASLGKQANPNWQRLRDQWDGNEGGMLREYCRVVVYWINNRMRRP